VQHLRADARVLCVDVGVDPGVEESPRAVVDLTFDAWATARVPGLLRFAYLVVGSQHAAEDAVQDALTAACVKWSTVSRTRDPDAYVRRMIVNAHVSGWRRTRRESPVELVRSAPVESVADRVSTEDAVWRVCQRLPRQQRAAVVLRFYEDLDYPEIAQLLGLAEPTVRSHVHRALAALRVELTAQEDET
jgi:RNA polymerase sigma-70 factor (sigma-E family)